MSETVKIQPADAPTGLSRRSAPFLTGLRENLLVVVLIGFAVWLVLAPLGQLLVASFQGGTLTEPEGWTFKNYAEAYSSKVTYEAIFNTLVYAVSATFLSLIIAVSFAWLTERTDLPWRNAAWILLLIPMAMPGILFAMGWTFLLDPRIGLVNIALRFVLSPFGFNFDYGPLDIYTLWGLIYLDGIRGTTTIFLIITGAFRMMDPALEESARASGASGGLTLRRVTLPLMLPAIFAAGMYSLLVSLDSFEVPMVIGLPGRIFVFTTLIYFSAQGLFPPSYGLAGAFAATFLLFSLILIYVSRRVVRDPERFSTVTGKGYRPRRVALGRWRYPAFCIVSLYTLLAVVLPLLVLIWVSLLPSYQVPSPKALQFLSLENYKLVLTDEALLESTINTLVVAASTATMALILAFSISWVVVRLKLRGRGFLDSISFLPQAIPSIIIALALVFLYIRPPFNAIPIYGTIWIIVLGLTTSYLAFSTRAMNGAVIQVSKELEEAARASGAGKIRTLCRITLPLILPAFISAWIWVAAHAIRAFSIPLILASEETELISVLLWHTWETGDAPQAAALGALLIVALAIMTALGRWAVVKMAPQD